MIVLYYNENNCIMTMKVEGIPFRILFELTGANQEGDKVGSGIVCENLALIKLNFSTNLSDFWGILRE